MVHKAKKRFGASSCTICRFVMYHLCRDSDRFQQAAAVGLAGAGQFQRSAMVNRGADDRQAERDVCALAEAGMLEHRQALIVVHRKHAIALRQFLRSKQRVGRQRRADIEAFGAQPVQYRNHDFDFLASQMAAFASVRVQSCYQDARLCNAEAALQIAPEDVQHVFQQWCGDCGRYIFQREVCGGQRYAHPCPDKHHDDMIGTGLRSEKFGVPGERDAGIVDDTLVHRCGDHAGKFTGLAALYGTAQHGQYICAVGYFQHAGLAWRGKRNMDDRYDRRLPAFFIFPCSCTGIIAKTQIGTEQCGALLQQAPVGHDYERDIKLRGCQLHA